MWGNNYPNHEEDSGLQTAVMLQQQRERFDLRNHGYNDELTSQSEGFLSQMGSPADSTSSGGTSQKTTRARDAHRMGYR